MFVEGENKRLERTQVGRPLLQHSDPSPAYRVWAVSSAAIGYAVDGFDLLILTFALGGIMATFRVSDTEAAFLTTLTLLGAVTGGAIFGHLADRLGRIRVLTWSVLFFAVFTGLCAVAPTMTFLQVSRFLAGVGIGGEFGIGMTLAAEAVPRRWRTRGTSWVAVGFQLGVLAAALVSIPILAAWGWRGLFAVGALPALLAFAVRRRIPESPEFLEAVPGAGTMTFGKRLRGLVQNRATARITVAVVVLTSVQNFGYYGLMTWLPHYLDTRAGFGVTKGVVWTTVTILGMLLGIVAFGQLADRVSRRWAFWVFQIGAAVSILVYTQLQTPTSLLLGGFVMGIFANGMLGGYGALIADLYPTNIRATAQNVLFNVGRGVGGFGPVVLAALAASHGFGFALTFLPLIYLLAFAAMFALPRQNGHSRITFSSEPS